MGLIRRFLWWLVGGDSHLRGVIADSYSGLARRHSELGGLLNSLGRQVEELEKKGREVHASHGKQIADLRAIVAHLGEETKKKPATARSMAELRQFMRRQGDGDAA